MAWLKKFLMRLLFKETMAESIDDFVHHVLKEECESVEIMPMHNNSGLIGATGVSMGALSSSRKEDVLGGEYYLVYIARNPSCGSGSIVYEGKRIERYVPLDEAEQNHEKESLKMFIGADEWARYLRARLATVRVEVVFEGIPVDVMTRYALYARALECGLALPK